MRLNHGIATNEEGLLLLVVAPALHPSALALVHTWPGGDMCGSVGCQRKKSGSGTQGLGSPFCVREAIKSTQKGVEEPGTMVLRLF